MKSFIILLALFSSYASSALIEYTHNFGTSRIFDRPSNLGGSGYPNFTNTAADHRLRGGHNFGDKYEDNFRYFGFKFSLTGSFMWQDGNFVHTFEDAVKDDFYINAYLENEIIASYKVVASDKDWYYGNMFVELPESKSGFNIDMKLETDGQNSIFIFDHDQTAFYASDKPLHFVPETGTFALFMAGIVGLCVRRQIKANATLPV